MLGELPYTFYNTCKKIEPFQNYNFYRAYINIMYSIYIQFNVPNDIDIIARFIILTHKSFFRKRPFEIIHIIQ